MSANTVFKERREEVRAYLRYLKDLESQVVRDRRKKKSEFFFRIAKANLFVMLYNLVESSTTYCLIDIDNAIRLRGVTAKTATRHIREQWLRDICRESWEFRRLVEVMEIVLDDATLDGLAVNKMVSMNVDHTEIHSIASKLGLTMRGGADGVALETIRNRRNELAHGNERFSVVGGSYDVATLENLSANCFSFVGRFVKSVERYIANNHFQRTAP